MKKRILFGFIMITVLAALLWLDWWLERSDAGRVRGLPLALLLLPVMAVAYVEMARLAAAAGVIVLILSGLFGTLLLATLPFWWQLTRIGQINADSGPALLTLSLISLLVFAEQMIRHRTSDALRQVACTFLAIVYLGVGGAIILWIRVTWGVGALVMFLATVKCTDIGAYFTGSLIGKHKMIPWLSPGKSWEGLIGGLAAAAGAAALAAWLLGIVAIPPFEAITPWQAALFGVAVGLAGQFADLCESLLKRSVKQKDSGAVVPEFGGVLDIIDSPLLAAPVACLALSLMI